MTDDENREVIERYWHALERSDFDDAVAELHEDFAETFPQSGETIRGKDNFLQVLRNFPSFPSIRVHRHLGAGNLWMTEAAFDYSKDGSQPPRTGDLNGWSEADRRLHHPRTPKCGIRCRMHLSALQPNPSVGLARITPEEEKGARNETADGHRLVDRRRTRAHGGPRGSGFLGS